LVPRWGVGRGVFIFIYWWGQQSFKLSTRFLCSLSSKQPKWHEFQKVEAGYKSEATCHLSQRKSVICGVASRGMFLEALSKKCSIGLLMRDRWYPYPCSLAREIDSFSKPVVAF
jgi:hypothetical protein